MTAQNLANPPLRFTGFLGGLRVLEIGNELGEYCGKVLAGLGADVVRVEPPTGETTRGYGPFYRDRPEPNRSLYFWHYNLGKRSITVDLDTAAGRGDLLDLMARADVVIESRPRGYMTDRSLDYEAVSSLNPGLIYARISPFGDTGPWADFASSDLVHLALGGVMMNCGYDPDPAGRYDTPPIAPQMWHSYHITGEIAAISIIAAAVYRLSSGQGQYLSTSVHGAVSQNTETDIPNWLLLRQTHHRLTCRHSMPAATGTSLSMTKDGRFLLPYRTYTRAGQNVWENTVELLKDFDAQADLEDPKYGTAYRGTPEASDRITQLTDKLVMRFKFDRDLWRDAQAHTLAWAPIRRPEENLADPHWLARGAFVEVKHPELGETFMYSGGKWRTEGMEWCGTRRPPLVGEHCEAVRRDWADAPIRHEKRHVTECARRTNHPRPEPFALAGVRVIDLGWMLASAGAGRFLSAMGAEVIKVEHESRWDGMRFSVAPCPTGGREERDVATGPIATPEWDGPNRSGMFMDINAGKLGLSLNLKNPRGRQILEDLIRGADIVVEGFSPGTMKRMGLGYDRLRELNPDIIYVQQSGFGEAGTYANGRAYGPTAQAITGISDMSGLPSPYPPAGIGYSYLDWFGAYNMALAMLAALYRRDVTGEGCHVDASQSEAGLYIAGTAILDYSVNGRSWARYGNRSPYVPAAPHGAFPTQGNDRWIAIAVFDDTHWTSLASVLGDPLLADDDRFATMAARVQNEDVLEALIGELTKDRDGFELMSELQALGVTAGVCQTAEDRCETDPQLRHLNWLVERDQTSIGRWPVRELPTKFSGTPADMGGILGRSGPDYGEDTDYVLRSILGLTADEVTELREQGAV